MSSSQKKELDRKKLFADPFLITVIAGIFLFLFLFILYPLSILLVDSMYVDSRFTLDVFFRILNMHSFKTAITNTLFLGMITGIAATLIGFLFAYVDAYVNTGSKAVKGLFNAVSILPVVSPPFVLSLSAILLFGRTGIVTRGWLNLNSTGLYGLPGIALVQTLTFFPVCYLMLKGLLKNIDPSLEEAARNMGASRWHVFKTVTLPLLLPGLGNAFLITFIESVADFANPMIIGGNYDTLATSIYLQLTGAYDKSGAAAMAVVLLTISMGLFLMEKYYLERKSVATLTGKASRERALMSDKSVRVPLIAFCVTVTVFVLIMYALVPFGSLFKLWGRDYSLSLKWYEYVFKNNGYRVFTDSILLSLIASPLTALLSMMISYLVVKRNFKGKALMEFTAMLAMAVPGTVLGVGFIRGFNSGLFHTGLLQGLYGTGAILVIVFIVRSLPVGTRSGIAALRQIDKSIEESAYDLGANSAKVFTSVTLPLIKESFFSGLVTTFVRSITAISAIILLVTPKFLLITVRINEHAEKGNYSIACTYATVLILITYTAIMIMNIVLKRFGKSTQRGL
ncbi:ABC transporter permease [Treponema maltophilum]|uniref:ABC transporter permease n=1 Tax=Treponema maltophilum TaxID=51160 RepID=UPI003D8EF72D